MRIYYKNRLIVFASDDSYTFYHGTDSDAFDEFDSSKAKKGEVFFNPLGDAMYVTDKQDFAKFFGKNVYPVKIPKDAKIKRMSPSIVERTIWDIINRSLKRCGINYWDTSSQFRLYLNEQLKRAKYSPYDAIIESVEVVNIHYPDKYKLFSDSVSLIATKKFSRYDVVIFIGTNNPNDIFIGESPTKEILIFNKEMQKIFRGDV